MDWDSSRSGSIMKVITEYFVQEGVNYRQLNERACHAGFQGKHLSYQMFVFSHEEQQRAVFYATMPLRVQPEQRPVVAEYLSRANYGLMLGNFEMDFESGDVRYKTSIDVEGGELTPGMVKTLVHTNLSTADKYAKGLIGVLYRDLTPVQALAELEGHSAMQRRAAQAALN